MPTHVYANNNEVASKAADGKSIAAFPDVCFSPPAPPVGPMPLPYPNTGEVKDTDSGTAKVFVKDKMSGMGDDSHMTKSMGDDAATKNFNKGMITGALQGKCYFGLWSMDVQMEGKGVPRHLDMVTHNHGSMMGQCAKCNQNGQHAVSAVVAQQPKEIATCSYEIYFVDKNYNLIQSIEQYLYKKFDDSDLTFVSSTKHIIPECNIPVLKPLCITNQSKNIRVSLKYFPTKLLSSSHKIAPNNQYTCIDIDRETHFTLVGKEETTAKYIVRIINKTHVVFIGGAGDTHSEIMRDVSKAYQARINRSGISQTVRYFTYTGGSFNGGIFEFARYTDQHYLLKYVKEKCKLLENVVIIGHSWGGDTAVNEVVAELTVQERNNISLLVTLDPVGFLDGNPINKITGITRYINIYVDYAYKGAQLQRKLSKGYNAIDSLFKDNLLAKHIAAKIKKYYKNVQIATTAWNEKGNSIATIGQYWGHVPGADINLPQPVLDHEDAKKMFDFIINEVLNK